MTWPQSRTANGLLTSAEAAAAMAMYWVRTEETAVAMGFSGHMVDLKINRRDTLGEALRKTSSVDAGPTDCSLPMQWALKNREDFDCFNVLTDNETWYGQMHPQEALRQYRDRINPEARQVVTAFVASKKTIADPNDPRSLDIVGFDASVPQIVAAFVAD
jgi:60 kDa SS-A/Ro ribonucleoprotein